MTRLPSKGLALLSAALVGHAVGQQSLPEFRDFGGPGPDVRGTFPFEATLDFNDDGANEVVTSFLDSVSLYQNDATGSFSGRATIALSGYPTSTTCLPVVGDIDSDGYDDLIVLPFNVNQPSLPPTVLINDRRGGWTVDRSRFPASYVTNATRGFWIDVEFDGDLDLVLSGPSQIELLVNLGGGRFVPALGSFPAAPPKPMGGFVGDFNGDGLDDLLIANGRYTLEPDIVYLNDGALGFTIGWSFPPQETISMDAADIDGDGDLDVLLGITAAQPGLWLNDGNAVFSDVSARLGPPRSPAVVRYDCQFADLNLDGAPDVYMAEGRTGGIQTFLNDGTGRFTDVSASVPWTHLGPGNLRFRDYDRDGDLDVSFYRTFDRAYVFHNLHRHVHATDPTLGGTFDVEIWAPPGHAVTYAAGFARRDFHIPPFGWWALDPALAVAYPGTLNIPPTGSVTSSLPVPNLPALRGVEIMVQALEFDPNDPNSVRTTNFDRSVFR